MCKGMSWFWLFYEICSVVLCNFSNLLIYSLLIKEQLGQKGHFSETPDSLSIFLPCPDLVHFCLFCPKCPKPSVIYSILIVQSVHQRVFFPLLPEAGNLLPGLQYPDCPPKRYIFFSTFRFCFHIILQELLIHVHHFQSKRKRRGPHFYDSRLTLHLFIFNIVPKSLSLWESLVFRHPTPKSLYPRSEIHQSLP